MSGGGQRFGKNAPCCLLSCALSLVWALSEALAPLLVEIALALSGVA